MKKAETKTGSTKTAKRAAGGKKGKAAFGAKADFIRARPNLKAKEIVEQAKAAGLDISAPYVYILRGATKKRAAKAASGATKRKPGRPKGSVRHAQAHASPSRAEALLKAIAAEIGLSRALSILEAEHARVKAVLA